MTPHRGTAAARPRTDPTADVEISLARDCGPRAIVVGLDEVGRGAIAGPVVVGACALRIEDGRLSSPLPPGVRDSKALTARRREALVDPIRAAVAGSALGWASAAEIDAHGIVAALTLAALRALGALGPVPDAILLDGTVDVLAGHLEPDARGRVPAVTLRIGADRDCLSVAAASVLAKVARDAHMVALDRDAPQYGWASNKGYGAAAHRAALARIGAHAEHRRSWNLGPLGGDGDPALSGSDTDAPDDAAAAPPGRAAVAPATGPGESVRWRTDVLWTDDRTGRGDRSDDGQQEDAL